MDKDCWGTWRTLKTLNDRVLAHGRDLVLIFLKKYNLISEWRNEMNWLGYLLYDFLHMFLKDDLLPISLLKILFLFMPYPSIKKVTSI